MTDTIAGTVTTVIDGDTFDLRVYHRGGTNSRNYGDNERVRIANINAPEINEPGGKRSKDALTKKILDKTVVCYIQARDTYGRLVSEVHI